MGGADDDVATLTKRFTMQPCSEIWDAMKVTFRHMFHRPITFQYPRERTLPIPIGAHYRCCAATTAARTLRGLRSL